MKIVTIVGARPQFVKAAMISRAIREYNLLISDPRSLITEILIHTGQHYDYAMSQSFFDQMDMPTPNYHLDVGSGTHGDQTGRMLASIEKVLLEEKPDAVLIYGDTNSTIAGSLAAAKLHISVGHVEGGMRSFNRKMPEEINRVVSDHIATWHFCATQTAVDNLKNEGVTKGIHLVGDVMHDAVMLYKDIAAEKSTILQDLGLVEGVTPLLCKEGQGEVETVHGSRFTNYALCTVHRAENTDDSERLRNIFEALAKISKRMPVVLPLHPRTRKAIDSVGLMSLVLEGGSRVTGHGLRVIDPLPYLDILRLEQSASVILTDSGGMQKEAFWLRVPCITMRDETEWVETVEAGMNKVVGADKQKIFSAAGESLKMPSQQNNEITEPSASAIIIELLAREACETR